MALLEVNNLKKWYPVKGGLFAKKRQVKAVDGVTFELEAGETVGLVGESGCGKSTLGRTIIRLEDPTGGSFKIDNIDISKLRGEKLRRMRNRFQMIFQDPYGSLNPRMTIHNMLYEVLGLHTELDREGRTERISELLKMVGLSPEAMHRYPHQFSGGQRQRIGIARALAVNPALIIADEPVSALDVSVQAQIINLLKEIQLKTGVAYLFIAHDLAVVEHISNRILVMYLGRIVESGRSSELCAKPAHPYTKALMSAIPTVERIGKPKRIILPGDMPSPMDPPSGCPFHPRCPVAQEECRRSVPELKPVNKRGHSSACFFPEKVSSM